ncbi:MAG: hypothetical protein WAW37_12975 [Syntrophobacteraceae bacterium]
MAKLSRIGKIKQKEMKTREVIADFLDSEIKWAIIEAKIRQKGGDVKYGAGVIRTLIDVLRDEQYFVFATDEKGMPERAVKDTTE